jgi:transcription elongation factor GreB
VGAKIDPSEVRESLSMALADMVNALVIAMAASFHFKWEQRFCANPWLARRLADDAWHADAMNKAFTKEDDAGEPAFVAPRPPLPPDVPNYVTMRGLSMLREELSSLTAARAALTASELTSDQASARTALQRRIAELEERIGSASLVNPGEQPQDEVRFGARVSVQGDPATPTRHLEIVGVDEADPGQGRIAFVAPLARALLGRHVGDVVTFSTPRGEEELEILTISYEV